jgi:serine/threonine protein kinase
MPAIANRSEFLSIVSESKLFDDATLENLRTDPELSERPGECAEQLIRKGLLTRFQANRLLAGKYRGFVMGPYRLLDQIGKGGMGTVYVCEHSSLKRKVAIKMLSPELAENKVAVERFLREARSASALSHPNIVRVHHVGQSAGTHYIVMEYVDGATLEQVVDRKGPFTIAEAAQIAIQVAAGLGHAHEKGFVHRDIKPENLMITKNGQVKILDMGLTKSVKNASDNLTGVLNTNTILGTLDYLSPEQAIQNDVTPRSDVYSLGATLFMLLTGHSPYDGVPAQQKLMQHQFGQVPDLRDYRSDAPVEFAALLTRMMAKKPEDRPASADVVAAELARWTTENGQAANLTLPSRVMANPGVQSQTPTVRDAAGATSSDAKPAPVIVQPQPIEVSPSVVAQAPVQVRAKDFNWKVWAFLILLGLAIGIAAAIAIAKIL